MIDYQGRSYVSHKQKLLRHYRADAHGILRATYPLELKHACLHKDRVEELFWHLMFCIPVSYVMFLQTQYATDISGSSIGCLQSAVVFGQGFCCQASTGSSECMVIWMCVFLFWTV